MKKMLMLAFVAVSALIVSCGKDKEEKSKEESIVGTWYVEVRSIDGKDKTLDDCQKKSYSIFTDKTLTNVMYEKNQQDECVEDDKEEGTYTISGNQITVNFKDGDIVTSTFSINGNTLTVTHKETQNGKESVSVTIFKKR